MNILEDLAIWNKKYYFLKSSQGGKPEKVRAGVSSSEHPSRVGIKENKSD